MKQRLLVFFLLCILGGICFKNILFTREVSIASYSAVNITEFSGYDIQDNLYTLTEPQEAYIVISPPEFPIDGISIQLGIPAASEMAIQLYATEAGTSMPQYEENSVIAKGQTKLCISLPNNIYQELKLTVGDTTGITFNLQNIDLLESQRDYFQKDALWFARLTVMITICGMLSLIICNLLEHRNKHVNSQTYASTRDTNIELLRILCMLMIIAHHCVVHGGSFNMEYCHNKFIAMILLPGGKIGFTCFLAISTWFLVDTKFKTIRFIKVWLEVFLYSVFFAAVSLIISGTLTLKDFAASILPITGNSHGFASSYLLLYLLIPFLSKMLHNLTKFQARILLYILFYAQVISQIIGYINNYYQPIFSEILLFILFYVISFNLKKWPIKITSDLLTCSLSFCTVWILIVQVQYLIAKGSAGGIINFISNITYGESSLLYIIGGYSLFFMFKNIPMKTNKYINAVATINLGVLLIHDHNYFRSVLWNDIFECSQWYYSSRYILYILGCVLIIYVACGCIDYIRQYFIEQPLMKCKKLIAFTQKIDGKVNENG